MNNNNTLTSRLYPSRIDIPASARIKIVVILNQSLAATMDLKTQSKQAHWNVKGTDFFQLHELFDELAAELEEYVDVDTLQSKDTEILGSTYLQLSRYRLPLSSVGFLMWLITPPHSHFTILNHSLVYPV
jgi:uncharacterized protein YgbK (DUF1537 family)